MPEIPHRCDGGEPDQHDRAEEVTDPGRALRLDRKQREQDRHRGGNDIGLQRRGRHVRPSSADSTEIAGVIAPSP